MLQIYFAFFCLHYCEILQGMKNRYFSLCKKVISLLSKNYFLQNEMVYHMSAKDSSYDMKRGLKNEIKHKRVASSYFFVPTIFFKEPLLSFYSKKILVNRAPDTERENNKIIKL